MKILSKNSIVLLSFLLIINLLSAKCNDTIIDKNLQIELRTSYGFMICHHLEMKYFKAHFPLFELRVQQSTFGRKSWQSKSNYPAIGINFLYSGLGGFKEIGTVWAAYPYMSFNCLKSRKNQLNLMIGIGFGYLTTIYDAKENPKNTFIGAHTNAAINLAAEYNRFITNRLCFSAFIGFTHFSNGAKRTPNNGINIAHAGVTAKYFIKEPKELIPKQNIDNQQYKPWSKKNISYYFSFTYAFKDTDEYLGYGKSWDVYDLHINAMKRLTEMSKVGVGFDLSYDFTDKEVLKFKGIAFKDFELLKPSISAVYEIAFGNMSFLFDFGYHIYCKDDSEGRVYQRISSILNLSKHVFATCALVTHYGWADNFCFGLGYRIN